MVRPFHQVFATDSYRALRALKINIDNLEIESHPDLAVAFLANQTRADLVVEVCSTDLRNCHVLTLG